MSVIGMNFYKISAEIKEPLMGKINITNNITIKDVEKKKIVAGTMEQEALRFMFEFNTNYQREDKTDAAVLVIAGDVIFSDDPKVLKKHHDQWKKEKKMPQDVMLHVLNVALTKCNIESLKLSQLFNLPPPIPLPKVNIDEGASNNNYIG